MAAEDSKGKKRKGASDAAPKAKKPRKSDDVAAAPKPAKAAKAAPAPAKTRSSRKQAVDFFSDEEAPVAEPAPTKAKNTKKNAKAAAAADAPAEEEPKVEEKPKKQGKKAKAAPVEETPAVEAPKEKAKKASKSKKAAAAPAEEEPVPEAVEDAPSKKSKKGKTSKKAVETAEPEVKADDVDLGAEEDDQTAALLAGFESEGDEEDPEDDDGFDKKKLTGKGFTFSKEDKAIMEFAEKHSTETGVVYVGRIPRGFFEPQMKKYFSQFGRVRRLRLSRNKKTGAPKHFAFVEFASPEVADIVARTMDNYLLFGHILKCKVIPNEQVHADMFKGAGERFKVDPRNKKAGLEMERGVDRAQWDKRVEKENKRRTDKADALKEDFGYEFKAPKVKSTKHVPAKLENGDAQKLVEAEPEENAAIEEPKPKRGKKAAAAKEEAPVEPVVEKKAAKSKMRKSDVVPETVEETPEKKRKAKAETEAAKPKKAKKAKA